MCFLTDLRVWKNKVEMDSHDCQRCKRTIEHSKRMKENDKRTHRSTVTSIKSGVKMKIYIYEISGQGKRAGRVECAFLQGKNEVGDQETRNVVLFLF